MIQFHIFPEPLRSPDNLFPSLVIKEKKRRSRGEREKALHHLGFGPPEPTGPAGRPTPPHRSLPPLPVPLLRVATGARSTPTTSPASPGEDKGDASGSPSTCSATPLAPVLSPRPLRLSLAPQIPSPSHPNATAAMAAVALVATGHHARIRHDVAPRHHPLRPLVPSARARRR